MGTDAGNCKAKSQRVELGMSNSRLSLQGQLYWSGKGYMCANQESPLLADEDPLVDLGVDVSVGTPWEMVREWAEGELVSS